MQALTRSHHPRGHWWASPCTNERRVTNMSTSRVSIFLAVAAMGVFVGASPAYASDGSVSVNIPATTPNPDATATWTDVTDNLCTVENGDKSSTATITINSTGAKWSVSSGFGVGDKCTGNLSIPEDKASTLKICATAQSQTACNSTQVYT